MNTTTKAQRHNARQDKIWQACKTASATPEGAQTVIEVMEKHQGTQGKPELPQDDDGRISREDWRALAITRYSDVERYRTHAEALAEALRILNGCAERGLEQSATHDGLSNCDAIAKARNALAQWEAAK